MFGGFAYYYDIKRLLFDNVIALKTIILRGTNYWNYFIVQILEDNVHPSFKYIRMSSECFEKRHLYRNNYIEKCHKKYRIVCNKQNEVSELSQMKKPDMMFFEVSQYIDKNNAISSNLLEPKYVYLKNKQVTNENIIEIRNNVKYSSTPFFGITLMGLPKDYKKQENNPVEPIIEDLYPYVRRFFIKDNVIDYDLIRFVCQYYLDIDIDDSDDSEYNYYIEYLDENITTNIFEESKTVQCL